MSNNTRNALLQSEQYFMEEVYRELDKRRGEALEKFNRCHAEVQSGGFEDQAAFMAHGDLSQAINNRHEEEYLVKSLYKKPYFAHIEAIEGSENDSVHYFLSDCENLDNTIPIDGLNWLLPFKRIPEKPVSSALFHCYQSKRGEPVRYKVKNDEWQIIPRLICDDEIDNRKLLDVIQFFPEIELEQVSSDDLLEEKLRENRSDPSLRNIIATLQRSQFEIIEADIEENFVVQGCAGSGKTQCLLHRLFYLRDVLSQDGWDHVLILTPTQLFRNYSTDLIRRYQLASVSNCSIADLYRDLLNAYDARFKNRQYRFELTEEYLPDEYLHEIYDPLLIERINTEIHRAVNYYVKAGCEALGIAMPELITSAQINEIVRQLDEAIRQFDTTESVLQMDEQYAEKRKEYEALQKRMESFQKRRNKTLKDYERIEVERKELDALVLSVQEAEQERQEWIKQVKAKRENAITALKEVKKKWDAEEDIRLPSEFARRLYVAEDVISGEAFKADEEYTRFLGDYCEQMKSDLQEVIKSQSPEAVYAGYEKKKTEIMRRADLLADEMEKMSAQIEEYADWLRNHSSAVKGEDSTKVLRRSEMERARYFLTRIESTVFERDVWNALVPLKEKYHVQTVHVEDLEGGRRKETRILYKSDVLFYLQIYASLYPNAELPEYHLICVDEGQDLHKADYDMLHRLYPDAVFNVFGDINQVLHTACGIQDWKKEAEIDKEYIINRNYRNSAPIVDFCNRTFGTTMKYIGDVRSDEKIEIMNDLTGIKTRINEANMTLIVKDRKTFEQFCVKIGKPASDFEYLDTKSEKVLGEKIPCYSVFAAKGLEFTKAIVYAAEMTKNQKVVASTRATEELYYYE